MIIAPKVRLQRRGKNTTLLLEAFSLDRLHPMQRHNISLNLSSDVVHAVDVVSVLVIPRRVSVPSQHRLHTCASLLPHQRRVHASVPPPAPLLEAASAMRSKYKRFHCELSLPFFSSGLLSRCDTRRFLSVLCHPAHRHCHVTWFTLSLTARVRPEHPLVSGSERG